MSAETAAVAVEVPLAATDRSLARELGLFARRNPLSLAGGLVGLAIIVVALFAPWIAPRDPLKANFARMN